MTCGEIWKKAQTVPLQVAEGIRPEFDIGFDKRIPAEMQDELRSFVTWVESHYRVPVTLWVDFAYRHYLIRRDGERVGYLFYWPALSTYPVFDDPKSCPVIRLPVRTEHSAAEEILRSFIEAITCYYAWICNEMRDCAPFDRDSADKLLQKYLRSRQPQRL